MTGEPQPDRIITYEHALRIYNYFQKIGSLREASYFWGEFKNCNLHGSITNVEKVLVYQYPVSIPLKSFPSIKRRKLAVNDIGDNEDGFSRLDFELKNGDVIQVLRQKREQ